MLSNNTKKCMHVQNEKERAEDNNGTGKKVCADSLLSALYSNLITSALVFILL